MRLLTTTYVREDPFHFILHNHSSEEPFKLGGKAGKFFYRINQERKSFTTHVHSEWIKKTWSPSLLNTWVLLLDLNFHGKIHNDTRVKRDSSMSRFVPEFSV
ncbi:hypothetical protein CHS0354_039271 [Potamilus streckersoni]|uniref:Uncharacterized protein n=1 Tax=Potamilus streckersoni TaxID=2493646 RepID=A0AAE0RNE4_9BIVA|nr:hypothetical protein CHS0354_039271 [Potamilus streckersoni]